MGNNTSHTHGYSHTSNTSRTQTGSSNGTGGGAGPSNKGGAGASPPSPPDLGPPVPPPESTFVDGGYLLPLSNIYPASPQDWLHGVVQRLILARKLAPFYRGLEDWEEDWDSEGVRRALEDSKETRLEAVRRLEEKEDEEKEEAERVGAGRKVGKSKEGQTMDAKGKKEAAKAVGWEIRDREVERYVGSTSECPLCFLYYPPNINTSRCCQQPICTECFVQIKRTDPTPQELKSEPVCCPYCVESNFGVTYESPLPSQRTDWEAPTTQPIAMDSPSSGTSPEFVGTPTSPDPNASAFSTTSTAVGTPSSATLFAEKSRRRKSTSHTSPEVVTTDAVQQDWRVKLEAVKAAVQRRANRRIIFRQEGDRLVPVGVTSSRDPMGHAFLAALGAGRAGPPQQQQQQASEGAEAQAGGDGNGSRRGRRHRDPNYGVDLEELMVMEAMRLSLVEEEERQKKEKAEQEKKEKEAKKAEKERLKEEEKRRLKEEKKAHKGKHAPSTGTSTPVASTSTPATVPSSTGPNRPRSSSAVRELFSRHHSPPTIPAPVPPPSDGEHDLERQISDAMRGSHSPSPAPAALGRPLTPTLAAPRPPIQSAASQHSSLNRFNDEWDPTASSARSTTSSEGAALTRQSTEFSMGSYQQLSDGEDDSSFMARNDVGGASSWGAPRTSLTPADLEGAVQVPQRGSSVPPSQ